MLIKTKLLLITYNTVPIPGKSIMSTNNQHVKKIHQIHYTVTKSTTWHKLKVEIHKMHEMSCAIQTWHVPTVGCHMPLR